ncbi:hypothetical protein ACRHK7_04430 [Weissella tructae]|uniref:Uncharacterized protein n=2 Tax=Weissella TaxID=46255 RepID=A0A075U4L1_9LACO|nr:MULTISPECIES: hypothetical protein [Weissella]AIG65087.1 hypothetical protein WS08_0148 [Weissella tructae]AIM62401.1 hypothetical protein WS74_0149 [Weissella ceti]AIM63738.1 hypothetical protein WS105_0148 [Weissella ceti]ELA07930.1 hypothetical protein WCNC_00510 [Weissella ceti NC36]QVV91484.1 hypothetical protein KHQ32_00870 [Weissella tructae]
MSKNLFKKLMILVLPLMAVATMTTTIITAVSVQANSVLVVGASSSDDDGFFGWLKSLFNFGGKSNEEKAKEKSEKVESKKAKSESKAKAKSEKEASKKAKSESKAKEKSENDSKTYEMDALVANTELGNQAISFEDFENMAINGFSLEGALAKYGKPTNVRGGSKGDIQMDVYYTTTEKGYSAELTFKHTNRSGFGKWTLEEKNSVTTDSITAPEYK